MTRPRPWLPRVAPLPLMLSGALVLALLVIVALWSSVRMPWLGVELEAAGDAGVRVVAVDPRGPLEGALEAGTVLTAVEAAEGERLDLGGYDPAHEPHMEPTYSGYNAYLARQGAIADAVNAGGAHFVTAEGRRVALAPEDRRPVDTLPAGFWFFHLFGSLAALVSLAVWAFRRSHPAARLLALSGGGFFAATWFNSVYLVRELALSEATFRLLSHANHWALALMLAGLLALLLHYPRRLTRLPTVALVAALFLFYQINESLQVIQWPLHTYYAPITLFYLLAIVAAWWQWRLSRGEPLDRAALKWVLLSVFVSMSLAFIVYFAPSMAGGEPLLPPYAMVGFGATLYLGFALGVLRYRLFELERWWFTAWAWFLGGLLVVVTDLFLVVLFGLQPLQALGLAVILVGWVYFPLRQWAWQRLTARSEVALEAHIPELVAALFTAPGNDEGERQWQRTLRALFEPLDISIGVEHVDEPRLENNGATLAIPALEPGRVWRLHYGRGGRRLFAPRDREQAGALLAVARRVTAVAEAKEAGARRERHRIARDLHDDIGGLLLNLVHRAPDATTVERAREALEALRGTLHVLRDESGSPLGEALSDWQDMVLARLDGTGTTLDWQVDPARDVELSPRQGVNLRRIVAEATTNALRHANPTVLRFQWSVTDAELALVIENDGCVEPAPEEAEARQANGRGRHNMQTRAVELRGSLEQGPVGDGRYRVHLRLPLSTEAEVVPSSPGP